MTIIANEYRISNDSHDQIIKDAIDVVFEQPEETYEMLENMLTGCFKPKENLNTTANIVLHKKEEEDYSIMSSSEDESDLEEFILEDENNTSSADIFDSPDIDLLKVDSFLKQSNVRSDDTNEINNKLNSKSIGDHDIFPSKCKDEYLDSETSSTTMFMNSATKSGLLSKTDNKSTDIKSNESTVIIGKTMSPDKINNVSTDKALGETMFNPQVVVLNTIHSDDPYPGEAVETQNDNFDQKPLGLNDLPKLASSCYKELKDNVKESDTVSVINVLESSDEVIPFELDDNHDYDKYIHKSKFGQEIKGILFPL